MALDTLQKLLDARAAAVPAPINKGPGADAGIGRVFMDAWPYNLIPGANPTAAQRRPDNTLVGHLLPDTPLAAAGKQLWLSGVRNIKQGSYAPNALVIYDRLYDKGAFVGNVATVQNVDNTAALPVNRGPGFDGLPGNAGEDVEIWLVTITSAGANAATIVLTYVNELGVAGKTTPSTLAGLNSNPGKVTQIPLASGDRGVQSVTSLQITTPTVSAGNFAVVLVRRLAVIPMVLRRGDTSEDRDWIDLALPLIHPRACVTVAYRHGGTQAAPSGMAHLDVIEV